MSERFDPPPIRISLAAGTRLYAFTDGGPDRLWWAGVDPLVEGDPGLDGHLRSAADAGIGVLEHVRDRFAADDPRDALGLPQLGMARCLHATLLEDAEAEVGRVRVPSRRFRPVEHETETAFQVRFDGPPRVRSGPIRLLP